MDIGGTFLKAGLVRGSRLLREVSIPTGRAATPAGTEFLVSEALGRLGVSSGGGAAAVGVGIPGLVRFPAGVVVSCVNLPGWKEVPLKKRLSRRLGLPVFVDNDVNVMTLAEWRYGAGKGAKNLVGVTLGTGVGGGLVIDGRFYRGSGGSAGEIGHLPLAAEGPACPCGGRACLEQTVGNKQILGWVKGELKKNRRSRIWTLIGDHLEALTPEVIDRACREGDPLARKAWRRSGEAIGLALSGAVNLLNPDRIVIGGGIAKAGHWLFTPIRKTVRQRAMRGLKDVPIVPARLGTQAGMIGAARLAQEELERS